MGKITKQDSIDKTKLLIQVMQAYVDGKDVFSQHKGFTAWGKIEEVGFMRHQWDSRNENYRVMDNGEIILEIGSEFEDSMSEQDHIDLQRKAFAEAKDILTEGDETMWHHYCVKQEGTVFTKLGDDCPKCGNSKPVNLRLA
jgi:hypothetical protein